MRIPSIVAHSHALAFRTLLLSRRGGTPAISGLASHSPRNCSEAAMAPGQSEGTTMAAGTGAGAGAGVESPSPRGPLDLFSGVAASYAKYRPTYPDALFAFLDAHCPEPRLKAWDVATGSGQVAVRLAERFQAVVGTDISPQQLSHAPPRPNVTYAVTAPNPSDAELDAVVGPPGSVDLVTIGQGYHWFDFGFFPHAVARVLRPGGVVAVWSYNLATLPGSHEFDDVMMSWYRNSWPYWEPQRKFVDAQYRDIPFPFKPLPALAGQGERGGLGPHPFFSDLAMNLDHFFGYLSSWSAYATAAKSGVELLDSPARAEFQRVWGDPCTVRTVRFPIHLLIGAV